MDGDKWHKDRKTAETLLRALAAVTPDILKTFETAELERAVVLLATVMAHCGAERQQR